ncbi:MAG: hypothetical protein HZA10_11165 [Nitrospirae bacterium]|nr:hypothetical protein [Nitrospirota bacterium]
MGKLIVELPDVIHGELKKKAASHRKTLKAIITGLISEYLHVKDKQEHIQKTGLCGRWDDKRSADAIIKDIKIHRKWFIKRKN